MKTLRVLGSIAPLLLACSTPQTLTDKPAPSAPSAAASTSARPVAAATSAPAGAEAIWKHPGMDLSFRHPTWLKVQPKPDGATIQSEVLAEVEDLSDDGPPTRPTPFTITISIRHGKLLEVMKRGYVDQYFPTGREDSFKPSESADRDTVGGKPGYSFYGAWNGEQSVVTFAEVAPGWIVEISSGYVADKHKPKVSVREQMAAYNRVIATLAFKIGGGGRREEL